MGSSVGLSRLNSQACMERICTMRRRGADPLTGDGGFPQFIDGYYPTRRLLIIRAGRQERENMRRHFEGKFAAV